MPGYGRSGQASRKAAGTPRRQRRVPLRNGRSRRSGVLEGRRILGPHVGRARSGRCRQGARGGRRRRGGRQGRPQEQQRPGRHREPGARERACSRSTARHTPPGGATRFPSCFGDHDCSTLRAPSALSLRLSLVSTSSTFLAALYLPVELESLASAIMVTPALDQAVAELMPAGASGAAHLDRAPAGACHLPRPNASSVSRAAVPLTLASRTPCRAGRPSIVRLGAGQEAEGTCV